MADQGGQTARTFTPVLAYPLARPTPPRRDFVLSYGSGIVCSPMAKRMLSATAAINVGDPLAESVDRLTAELSVFRDVVAEIREGLSWRSRNGLPVQPIEHVVVKRMALDPCPGDWAEKLQLERFTTNSDSAASPVTPEMLDRITDDLKTTFEAIAQGQLEVVLTALDGVRGEVLAALKRRREPPH